MNLEIKHQQLIASAVAEAPPSVEDIPRHEAPNMNQIFAVPEREALEDHVAALFKLALAASVSTDAGEIVACSKYYMAQSFCWELLFLIKLLQLQSAVELC